MRVPGSQRRRRRPGRGPAGSGVSGQGSAQGQQCVACCVSHRFNAVLRSRRCQSGVEHINHVLSRARCHHSQQQVRRTTLGHIHCAAMDLVCPALPESLLKLKKVAHSTSLVQGQKPCDSRSNAALLRKRLWKTCTTSVLFYTAITGISAN